MILHILSVAVKHFWHSDHAFLDQDVSIVQRLSIEHVPNETTGLADNVKEDIYQQN